MTERDHWRQALVEYEAKQARIAALRRELAAARAAGKAARHRDRLRRTRAGERKDRT